MGRRETVTLTSHRTRDGRSYRVCGVTGFLMLACRPNVNGFQPALLAWNQDALVHACKSSLLTGSRSFSVLAGGLRALLLR